MSPYFVQSSARDPIGPPFLNLHVQIANYQDVKKLKRIIFYSATVYQYLHTAYQQTK